MAQGRRGACLCQGNSVGPAGQRQKEVRRDGPWAGRGSPLPVSAMGRGVALSWQAGQDPRGWSFGGQGRAVHTCHPFSPLYLCLWPRPYSPSLSACLSACPLLSSLRRRSGVTSDLRGWVWGLHSEGAAWRGGHSPTQGLEARGPHQPDRPCVP